MGFEPPWKGYDEPMTFRHFSLAVAAASILLGACYSSRPVIDTGARPRVQEGTIAGHVRTDGDAPLVSRVVRAVPVDGSSPHETTTNEAGSYTLKVPPGRYRLEVELRPGERIVKQPGENQVNPSDLDPDRNFVISAAR
jgi:hypothetical protein